MSRRLTYKKKSKVELPAYKKKGKVEVSLLAAPGKRHLPATEEAQRLFRELGQKYS